MNFIKDNRGATYVLTALLMTVIMGFGALVIDIGTVFLEKEQLANAADAAALAGAQELPRNPSKAVKVAEEYCKKNGVSLDKIQIIVSQDNKSFEVNVEDKVNYVFAKLLGINNSDVSVSSKAIIAPVTAVYEGIRPLVVEKQQFVYGTQVVIKEGAPDGTTGNYGAVALGGTGTSVYERNIKYGYNSKLEVGDWIKTETGNMTMATIKGVEFVIGYDYSTFDNYSRDSARLWTVPVVDSLYVEGRESVQIVGFAQFFIEDVCKNGGHTEITGRFIEFTTNGDIGESQASFGLNGVKLVK